MQNCKRGESKHMSAEIVDLGHTIVGNDTLLGLSDANVLTAFSAIGGVNDTFLTNFRLNVILKCWK
jgi:hypothetical protein